MSKELDYLDKILNYQPLTLVERTIIECIKEKIQRLEAIDNANPSEALDCLEKVKYYEVENHIKEGWNIILYEEMQEELDTIEKALLKAQEPKQYLKWEDLEFKKEEQTMKVLLNGERYLIKYVNEWFCGWCNKVQITNGTYILCTLGNGMKQFFNDLHLERVEE